MANVNFVVRSTKSSGTATVYVRVRNGKTDFKVSTKVEMPVSWWKHWANDTNSFDKKITIDGEKEEAQAQFITKNLKEIYTALSSSVAKYEQFTAKIASDIIAVIISADKVKADSPELSDNAEEYLPIKIAQMKSGKMLHKGRIYDDNTIDAWNSFYKLLCSFVEHRGYSVYFSKIDKQTYDSFVGFLNERDYMVKSKNKYITSFQAMVKFAFDDKIIDNHERIKSYFHKLSVQAKDKATKIYLNEAEIQALYDMKLDEGSMYDKVRDIFLCGCYTAQRVSDYGRLTPENFRVTERGNKVVHITQEKTDNEVVVPYLNDNLEAIVLKYNGEIPKVCDVMINRYIKQIGKILSESVPSLATLKKTILTQKEKAKEKAGKEAFERTKSGDVVRPRYDMICTHTARRSAITNMYLTRLFTTFQLMKISGHKTEKAFYEYICLSSDEIADEIAKILKDRKKTTNDVF